MLALPRKHVLIALDLFAACFFVASIFYIRSSTTSWVLPTRPFLQRPNGPFRVNPTAFTAPHDHLLPHYSVGLFVDSIMDPYSTARPRFNCPELNVERYRHLRASPNFLDGTKAKYFFALALKDEGVDLLPRLLGSVVQAMQFLGPKHCSLSIVSGGGGKPDGVRDVLEALRAPLRDIGVRYYLQRATKDPNGDRRITELARIRNMALAPITNPASSDEGRYTRDTTVVFLNDVAACAEDILELAHQRKVQSADMVCGMDYAGEWFYDVWVARTLAGDTFFHVPQNGSWDFASDLFPNPRDVVAKRRFNVMRPFQVYACWNGGAVFGAAPLFRQAARPGAGWDQDVADPRYKADPVRFRGNMEDAGECYMGEPTHFAKDLWYRGFGKIAVVPTVSLEYTMDKAKALKDERGFASEWIGDSGPELDEQPITERIEWQLKPPDEVLCARTWSTQNWRPWNESLAEPVSL